MLLWKREEDVILMGKPCFCVFFQRRNKWIFWSPTQASWCVPTPRLQMDLRCSWASIIWVSHAARCSLPNLKLELYLPAKILIVHWSDLQISLKKTPKLWFQLCLPPIDFLLSILWHSAALAYAHVCTNTLTIGTCCTSAPTNILHMCTFSGVMGRTGRG